MGDVILATVVIFILILSVVAAIVGYQTANTQRKRQFYLATAHPATGITKDDSLSTMQAKALMSHNVTEAARILSEIRNQDDLVPILKPETRKDLDGFLVDYYQHH